MHGHRTKRALTIIATAAVLTGITMETGSAHPEEGSQRGYRGGTRITIDLVQRQWEAATRTAIRWSAWGLSREGSDAARQDALTSAAVARGTLLEALRSQGHPIVDGSKETEEAQEGPAHMMKRQAGGHWTLEGKETFRHRWTESLRVEGIVETSVLLDWIGEEREQGRRTSLDGTYHIAPGDTKASQRLAEALITEAIQRSSGLWQAAGHDPVPSFNYAAFEGEDDGGERVAHTACWGKNQPCALRSAAYRVHTGKRAARGDGTPKKSVSATFSARVDAHADNDRSWASIRIREERRQGEAGEALGTARSRAADLEAVLTRFGWHWTSRVSQAGYVPVWGATLSAIPRDAWVERDHVELTYEARRLWAEQHEAERALEALHAMWASYDAGTEEDTGDMGIHHDSGRRKEMEAKVEQEAAGRAHANALRLLTAGGKSCVANARTIAIETSPKRGHQQPDWRESRAVKSEGLASHHTTRQAQHPSHGLGTTAVSRTVKVQVRARCD